MAKARATEAEVQSLQEQLQDEADSKADLQRLLSKANAEAQTWRIKYETEGVARADELQAALAKMQVNEHRHDFFLLIYDYILRSQS